MRILIEEKVQRNGELSRENNRTIRVKKNRKRNKKSNMPSLAQKLFQTCKEVFASCEAGTVPPPEDVERLRVVLDTLKPEDVGLTVDMPFFRMIDAEGSPPITYLHIFECNKFSMGIFCLPPSGVIPLHNHPGMTVFSKLLFGSMHIKSYDWVDMPHTDTDKVDLSYVQPAGVRLAKVKVDSVFTAPCNTSILYPADGGNMHCFTAVTSCAVLDVLGPPYSDPEGRHCTYYRDITYKKNSVLLILRKMSSSPVNSSRSCHYGSIAPVNMAWTDKNPGRRFVGCMNYQESPCSFFQWIDPEYPTLRDRVRSLHDQNEELLNENQNLGEKCEKLERKMEKFEREFEVQKGLNKELMLKMKANGIMQKKKLKNISFCCVFFAVLVILYMGLSKQVECNGGGSYDLDSL